VEKRRFALLGFHLIISHKPYKTIAKIVRHGVECSVAVAGAHNGTSAPGRTLELEIAYSRKVPVEGTQQGGANLLCFAFELVIFSAALLWMRRHRLQ